MSGEFKTSVRVLGDQQVDEFKALCVLLGRRPHQLAADMVLDGIRRYRADPDLAPMVASLVENARGYRAERAAVEAGSLHVRSGFRVYRGGGS